MLQLGRGVEKGVVCGDALAAVAVTGAAFAQNVTISGNLNFNAVSNGKTTKQSAAGAAETSTKTSNTGLQNGWTASQISFSGTEDLGGGLKASFVVNQNLDGRAAGMGDRDTNVALSGGFGTVRVGRFVPASATGYQALTGARTTNQSGSLYGIALSGTVKQADGVFGEIVGGSFERQTAVLQYTTPSFNGFTVNASYGKAGSDDSSKAGDANATQHGLSFNYSAGALTVGGGTNQRKTNSELVAGSAATGACLIGSAVTTVSATNEAACPAGAIRIGADPVLETPAGSIKAKLNWLGASYDLGVARVMGAVITRKGETSATGTATVTNTDIRLNTLGVHVPMGAFTLAASTYSGKNKQTSAGNDDLKLSGHQLSVTYALSKRTTVYAAMGENKSKREGGNTDGATVKGTSNAIGLMHTF